MRSVLRVALALLVASSLFLIGYFLHSPTRSRETLSVVAGLLAVTAAAIGAIPALRILELQEDASRPKPIPSFDLKSRVDLLQLRVKNFGASAAYNISLDWQNPVHDFEGQVITALDKIDVLLPGESVSVLVGASHTEVRKVKSQRFEGVCKFRDSTKKNYSERFVCSVNGSAKQLLHDDEFPKTLRELQDIPKALENITQALDRLQATLPISDPEMDNADTSSPNSLS